MEDTTEARNDEIFDLDINQIIEQQKQDSEILIYSSKCDKEHRARWDAYIEYVRVVVANTTWRIDAQITTMKRILKAVKAETEKQMIALQQKTL